MAFCLGAKIVEVHFKLSNDKYNLDNDASLNLKDIKLLCQLRDEIYVMTQNKVNKNILSNVQKKNRKIFTKSIALKNNLIKGEVIKLDNLTFKKPGFGIKDYDLKKVIGKKAKRKLCKFKLLRWADII